MGTTRVLKDINMTIKHGEFAAFVGPSGCGNSTMINLLERFYDPTTGDISFAGNPIHTYSPRLYRQNISLVQQEPTLYSCRRVDASTCRRVDEMLTLTVRQ